MGKGPRVDCSGDTPITQQSEAAECDINLIVERAKRGADLSHLMRSPGQYMDLVGMPDLREAMNLVTHAQTLFMALDARIRDRFANDPARMIDFLKNPDNRDEAIALGLVVAPPPGCGAPSGPC